MNTAPQLLSLGSVNADFQARVDRGLGSGGTLRAHDFVRLSGGKAANRAFLARRLGCAVRLFGCVGDDDLSAQALAPLRQAGVALDDVARAPGCSTAVSMITVAPDGSETIVLAGNANEAWTGPMIDRLVDGIEHAPDGSVLAADCEVSPAAVIRAVRAAAERGLPIVLDPSPPERVDATMLALALTVTPNPAEAQALTGITIDDPQAADDSQAADDPQAAADAARQLAARGVAAPCVKLPNGGCVLAEAGGVTYIPPVRVPVADRTGAGDAFAGALAVALLERRPLLQAALAAVAASHLAVTGYGSQPAYPGRGEIEALSRTLASNMRRI